MAKYTGAFARATRQGKETSGRPSSSRDADGWQPAYIPVDRSQGDEYDITRVITSVPVEATDMSKVQGSYAGRQIFANSSLRGFGVPEPLAPGRVPLEPIPRLAVLLAKPSRRTMRPSKPTVQPRPDPHPCFCGRGGVLLVAVKPTSIADYELVMRRCRRRRQADEPLKLAAPRVAVFRRPKRMPRHALYVHVMLPPARIRLPAALLLDELVKDSRRAALKSRTFAVPPSKLNLTEFANIRSRRAGAEREARRLELSGWRRVKRGRGCAAATLQLKIR